MKQRLLMMFSGILACLGATHALSQSAALEGWGSVAQWEDAVKTATEQNRPIVLLVHQFGDTHHSAARNNTARTWASDRSLRGMILIHVDRPAHIPEGPAINAQVEEDHRTSPRLFIVDPQLRVIGYRNNRHQNQLAAATQVAGQIMRWQAGVERDVAQARLLAEQGRLAAGLEALSRIAEQDVRFTHAVALLAVSAAAGEKPIPPDPPTEGRFFPGIVEQNRPDLIALADQRITEAENLYQDHKFREALNTLRPLASERGDLPQHEKARELSQQITEAMRQS